MLPAIALLTALSATSGLMGHSRQGCGGRMHHHRQVRDTTAPVMGCATLPVAAPTMMTVRAAPTPTPTPQAVTMPRVMASPSSPVITADTVPPAPVVPPAPAPPAPPAP